MKLGERGGLRRDFHDQGINTRHAIEHVRDCKTGPSPLTVHTRPDSRHTCNDTQSMSMLCVCASTGTSGDRIELTANFFRIVSRPQWLLYQYHVDFNPQMESRRLRSALLFQHEELLGSAHSFDGALLFLPHKLHNKVMRLFRKQFLGQNVILTHGGVSSSLSRKCKSV